MVPPKDETPANPDFRGSYRARKGIVTAGSDRRKECLGIRVGWNVKEDRIGVVLQRERVY